MHWIKLQQSIFSSPVADDAEALRIYLYLATHAAYRTMQVRGVSINQGQILTSTHHLAGDKALKRSRTTIIKKLALLKQHGLIEIEESDGRKLITITNVLSDDNQCPPNEQQCPPNEQQCPPNEQQCPSNEQQCPPSEPQNREEKEIYKEKEDKDNTVVPPCGGHSPTTSPPKDAKKRCFKKPTIEEIQQYIDEKGYTEIDAEMFWNFYESKNWMIGKNKMSKWKSAIATWRRKMQDEINYTNNYKNSRYYDTGNKIDNQTRRLQAALFAGYASIGGGEGSGGQPELSGVPEGLFG